MNNKEMMWLYLDPELYHNSDNITTFLIFTEEQFKKVKKWTLENMKKMNGIFSKEDYKKLEDDK
ncbi:MAG: hypothetical protein DRM99_02425 [Thermoplasmata archaeon]|nr:MAG: hypothetical protein DRM99_02425 [Thermoplasmata archaeon]